MAEDASRVRKNPGIFARIRSFATNILRANGAENIRDALFGEAALLADADTQEHLAIQAVAHHHNRLSATFSNHPDRYRPS